MFVDVEPVLLCDSYAPANMAPPGKNCTFHCYWPQSGNSRHQRAFRGASVFGSVLRNLLLRLPRLKRSERFPSDGVAMFKPQHPPGASAAHGGIRRGTSCGRDPANKDAPAACVLNGRKEAQPSGLWPYVRLRGPERWTGGWRQNFPPLLQATRGGRLQNGCRTAAFGHVGVCIDLHANSTGDTPARENRLTTRDVFDLS